MKGKLMKLSCSVSSVSVTLYLTEKCLFLALLDLGNVHIVALKDMVILQTDIHLVMFVVIYQVYYDYE